MGRTVIKKADWLVAWDPKASRHRYLENADLAFESDRIVYVGPDYREDATAGDETIDGRGMMIIPGLVDIHSHLAHEPINKGYTDETGSRGLIHLAVYQTSFVNNARLFHFHP